MNTVQCPNCGKENKNTNIRCEFCNTELNNINSDPIYNEQQKNIMQNNARKLITRMPLIIFSPFILGFLFIIGITVYINMSDANKTKNYLKTEGKLIDYKNCYYDEGSELCTAEYEYTVNGITYLGTSNSENSRSVFKKTVTVKYNPNDPSKYVIDSEWNFFLINCIIIGILLLVSFISSKKDLEKIFNLGKTNNKKKDNVEYNS